MDNLYEQVGDIEYHWKFDGSPHNSQQEDQRIGKVFSRQTNADGSSMGCQPTFRGRMSLRKFKQTIKTWRKIHQPKGE